jgi:aspartate racemase
MKTVGILGGMGPEATVALMSRVIAAVPARDDADHVPLLVDQNTQVPSRIAALIDGVGADPGPVLAGMAQRLQVAGAQALAMPCNTAHHYAPLIRSAATVPFLDMVGLSVVRVAALGVGTMGLLGSPALRRVGVYDAACANAGLQVVYLTDEDAGSHWPGPRPIAAVGSGVGDRRSSDCLYRVFIVGGGGPGHACH